MQAFQNILVPTDFSAHARHATLIAADLSRRYDARLTLIYVHEPITDALPHEQVMRSPGQLSQVLGELDERLADARREAEAAGATRVESQTLQGYTSEAITQLASEGGFDLLVMGTHGRKGVRHLLLGSIAERVVRTAPCSVLTVRLPPGA